MSISPQSAATRFIQVYLVITVVTTLATFLFIYHATIPNIEREAAREVSEDLAQVEIAYREHGMEGVSRQIDRFLEQNLRGASYLLLQIDSNIMKGDIESWPIDVGATEDWKIVSLRTHTDQKPVLMGVGSSEFPGGYQVLVGRDMQARTTFRKTATQAVLGALSVTIMITLGGGYLLSRFLLRRVEYISGTAERIMHSDLSQRIHLSDAHDEFDRLSRSLNKMLARMEDLVKSTRTVTDGIAHDFRSPLTRLKTQMEVTLRQPRSETELRESISDALEEIDGIIKTLNALLEIVRVENSVSEENMRNVDLAAITRDIGDLYQPVAEDMGLTLQVEIQSPLKTYGHPPLIAQAISNLVDNALKYSPPGTGVKLDAGLGSIGPYIIVSDTGPGIPEGSRNAVLERFVRLNCARPVPGAGLGLSLVAAVARQHNATLSMDDNHPGLKVTLNFKANPRPRKISVV